MRRVRRSVVVAALGALALVGLAVAAGQTRAATAAARDAQTFSDPAGDVKTAPDITTVTVSHDAAGSIAFTIDVANRVMPGESDYVGVVIDADRSAWTGDSTGFDYVLVKRPNECAAARWNGQEFDDVILPGLTCAYTGRQARLSVDRSGLDGTKGFYFLVLSLQGLSDEDMAPDAGLPIWSYELEPGSGPAEPPPTVSNGTPAPSTSEATLLHANGRIAFEREGALWTMNADGSAQRRLATKTLGNAVPSWSPDGASIAYLSNPSTEPSLFDSGPFDLYVIRADGSGRHRLARNAAPDYRPVWSPDGTKVAYVGGGTYGAMGVENPDIFVAKVAAARVTRLTAAAGPDDDPAWSPDGKRIAFASERSGKYGIFVIGANGRGVKRLTSNSQFDYSPSWSPDGARIAFVSRRPDAEDRYRDEIDVVNADGTGRIHFPKLPDQRVGFAPAWSPDGKRLVFQSGYESMFGSGYDLYLANTDGTGMRRVGPAGDANVHAAWSQDGKWIYFLSNRDTKDDDYCHDVYVAGSDSSIVRRLTTSAEHSGLAESGVDSFSLTPKAQTAGAGATAAARLDLATVVGLAGRTDVPAIAGWRPIGPENMDVGVLALDPKAAVVYAGGYQRNVTGRYESGVDGLFKTDVGSNAWARLTDDLLGEPMSLAVAPSDPRSMFLVTDYALETHLYRSSDAGTTWQELAPPAEDLRALAVDPRTPQTLYALTSSAGVYRTTNGGGSWARIAPIRAEGSILVGHAVLAVDAADPRIVYAGGSGLYRSTNGGSAWTKISSGVVAGLAFDPRHAGTLYALVAADEFDFAVMRSTDRGGTWKNVSHGVGVNASELAEGLDLAFDNIAVDTGGAVYASANDTLKEEAAVYKSTNDGRTWKRVAFMKATVPVGGTDLWVRFSGLVVERGGGVYAGTDGLGVYVCDGCKSAVSPPPAPPPKANGTVSAAKGLERQWVRGFAADPARPLVRYAATGKSGLFRSTDGGRSWSHEARPLGRPNVVALAVSRTAPNRLYAVASTGKRKDQFDPDFQGTAARSDDGGKTWRSIGAGLPPETTTAIALVPGTHETIVAGTAGGGVYRSVDGGKSWQRSAVFPAPGVKYSGPGISTIAVDPRNPRLLYAGTYWGAVYRSTDGGVHWRESPLGQRGHADVRQLVVDPFDSRTVWAGVWAGSSPGKGGVFRSGDRGLTWSRVSRNMPEEVQSLQLDTGRRGCVYAGTWGAGLYFTTSSGASWQFLRPAVPSPNIESLFSARSSRTLLVGTTDGAYLVSLR